MTDRNIKYTIVKNNCALMECYMGGCLAYFFTDKSDNTYYNTLDRGELDSWTVTFSKKENAEMVLDVIKRAWVSEGHTIRWEDEDEETCINEDPTGAEIVKIERVSKPDGTFRWIICEDCK